MQEKSVKFFDNQVSDCRDKYEKIDDLKSFIFFERKKIVLAILGEGFNRILDIGE